jgi:hypothetical protein
MVMMKQQFHLLLLLISARLSMLDEKAVIQLA